MEALRESGAVGDARADREHIRLERGPACGICLSSRSDGDVDCGSDAKGREQIHPNELAEPALECVAIHGRVLMARDDDPDARKAERGSEDPGIEMHRPNSLPLSNDGLNVSAPRQSVAARKTKAAAGAARRQRICSEV
jgi:hypothetical protein